jgi:hypothetical protein
MKNTMLAGLTAAIFLAGISSAHAASPLEYVCVYAPSQLVSDARHVFATGFVAATPGVGVLQLFSAAPSASVTKEVLHSSGGTIERNAARYLPGTYRAVSAGATVVGSAAQKAPVLKEVLHSSGGTIGRNAARYLTGTFRVKALAMGSASPTAATAGAPALMPVLVMVGVTALAVEAYCMPQNHPAAYRRLSEAVDNVSQATDLFIVESVVRSDVALSTVSKAAASVADKALRNLNLD